VAPWFGFVVASLATWRLCHLVAHEDGPFGAISGLRRRAGDGQLGRLMDCPYCLSLWFGVPFALWLGRGIADGMATWLALSGAACLIEHVTAALRARSLPPMIDLMPPTDPKDRA
jgi:hypothetical protein